MLNCGCIGIKFTQWITPMLQISYVDKENIIDNKISIMEKLDKLELSTSAEHTICDKMSPSGNKSIVDYLFDQGKCGEICRNGKIEHSRY